MKKSPTFTPTLCQSTMKKSPTLTPLKLLRRMVTTALTIPLTVTALTVPPTAMNRKSAMALCRTAK